MADNGQRSGGGKLIAHLRASGGHAQDEESEPRTRWEYWLLGAALCGLAYAGAMRYAAADVAALKHRALGVVSTATGGLVPRPSCLGCMSTAEPEALPPAPDLQPTVATASVPAAPRPEPFALDRDGACFARGVATLSRLAPQGEANFRSARIGAADPAGFAVPPMRAAYDDMLACVIAAAGAKLCQSEIRAALVVEVAAYLAGLQGLAAPAPAPTPRRGAKAREGADNRPPAGRVSKIVLAALTREAEAGRLTKSDFSADSGFLGRAPELDALFAARVRRTGCGAV